jgi:hypothetical protein
MECGASWCTSNSTVAIQKYAARMNSCVEPQELQDGGDILMIRCTTSVAVRDETTSHCGGNETSLRRKLRLGDSEPRPVSAGLNQQAGETRGKCQTYPAEEQHEPFKRARAARTFVQPVDEKTILHFFASSHACEDTRYFGKSDNGSHNYGVPRYCTAHQLSLEDSSNCSWKCGAFEGIPTCLGSRLSRRLPGEADFFQIDIHDLHATAAADARLTEIFALLRATSES